MIYSMTLAIALMAAVGFYSFTALSDRGESVRSLGAVAPIMQALTRYRTTACLTPGELTPEDIISTGVLDRNPAEGTFDWEVIVEPGGSVLLAIEEPQGSVVSAVASMYPHFFDNASGNEQLMIRVPLDTHFSIPDLHVNVMNELGPEASVGCV